MTERARRKVLVTGAGSGIGRAIARRLASAGHEVVGTVRDPKRAAALTAEAKSGGLSLSYEPLELTDRAQVKALAARLNAGGGVDVVVNNAGAGAYGSLEEVDTDVATWQFAVNVFGPLELTRALLPGLRQRKGHIVFIGSLAGRIALPFQAHYSASKAAIASISDALRMELAPFGVTVTCIEPGDFATGFTDARRSLLPAGSPYEARLRACLTAVGEQERGGPDPDWVARVVAQLVDGRRPPARRPVGHWARTISLLLRLLPDALRERMVLQQYKL